MLRLWGTLDLVFFVYYVAATVVAGKIPFLSGIQAARMSAKSDGSETPLILAVLGAALIVSTLWSGYALWTKRRVGRILVYGQLPLRLLLTMPSMFFIPWLMAMLPPRPALMALTALVIVTEGWKLVTVNRAYRRPKFSSESPA